MAKKSNPVPTLEPFEGENVLKTSLVLKNAGDGLSKPLAVAPRAIARGEEIFLVLRTTCTQVSHKKLTEKEVKEIRLPDGNPLDAEIDGLLRKHDLTVDIVTIVDGQLVAEMIDKQRALNADFDGVPTLDFEEERDPDD